jgi:mRNA interferase MazF
MQQLPPGTIVQVDLGLPPGTKGREQQKPRPCVVVVHWPQLQLLMAVPISGNRPKVELYTTVALKPGANGLTKDSFALCHQLRSISEERVGRALGGLSSLDLEKVRAVVKAMLRL